MKVGLTTNLSEFASVDRGTIWSHLDPTAIKMPPQQKRPEGI